MCRETGNHCSHELKSFQHFGGPLFRLFTGSPGVDSCYLSISLSTSTLLVNFQLFTS